MATTTTNFGWDSPQSTDLVKDGATAIAALGQDIDTAFVDLKGGTTGQVLAKASNTDLDYTWVAQDDSNAIQNAIVDAKGDLIAATAADTPARLAVGTDGQVLTASSGAATGLAWATPSVGSTYVAGKNGVINGAMDIWQRGTSGFTTTFAYNADRWKQGGAAAQTVSRQTVSDTTNLPTIQYCARIQRNSGSTSTSTLEHLYGFESVDSYRYAGQTVTLSFYARAGANYSATSSTLNGRIIYGTGTDQSVTSGFTGQTIVGTAAAALTTTWQRFSVTGTVAATATQMGILFQGSPTGTAGAADYYEVTGVQLEISSSATTFSRNAGSIQGELAACQRYYYRIGGEQTFQAMALGWGNGSAGAYIHITTPVSMRVAPTALDYSTLVIGDLINSNQAVTALLLTGNYGGSKVQTLSATVSSGLTVNRPYGLYANNSTSAFVGLSAEL